MILAGREWISNFLRLFVFGLKMELFAWKLSLSTRKDPIFGHPIDELG